MPTDTENRIASLRAEETRKYEAFLDKKRDDEMAAQRDRENAENAGRVWTQQLVPMIDEAASRLERELSSAGITFDTSKNDRGITMFFGVTIRRASAPQNYIDVLFQRGTTNVMAETTGPGGRISPFDVGNMSTLTVDKFSDALIRILRASD